MEKINLVKNSPKSIYYVPNFISANEEVQILRNIYNAPKPKWVQLKNRRLQNWGGIPQPKGMIPEDIPDWLQVYCDKIFQLGIFEDKMPNHILINEYLSGQGIMPHEDGSLYFPTVSTISLGSHTLLDIYKPIEDSQLPEEENTIDKRYLFSILLEPRSLVILKDDMYKVNLHGIKETTQDVIDTKQIINFDQLGDDKYRQSNVLTRDTRVSLTIRHVPKFLKINLNSVLFKSKK